MKRVKVHYTIQDVYAEGFLLESVKDLDEFLVFLKTSVTNVCKVMLESTLSNDAFDHIIMNFKAIEENIARMAVMKGKATQTHPAYRTEDAYSEYAKGIGKALANGDKVILNESGGWATVCELLEVVAVIGEQTLTTKIDYRIHKPTKYITIENDAKLENHSMKYLSKVDENYSYITELRKFDNDKLLELFKEFVSNGGEVLYVYTSGWDRTQAKNFYGIAYESGIRKIECEFSAKNLSNYHPDNAKRELINQEEYKEILNHFSNLGVEVTWHDSN